MATKKQNKLLSEEEMLDYDELFNRLSSTDSDVCAKVIKCNKLTYNGLFRIDFDYASFHIIKEYRAKKFKQLMTVYKPDYMYNSPNYIRNKITEQVETIAHHPEIFEQINNYSFANKIIAKIYSRRKGFASFRNPTALRNDVETLLKQARENNVFEQTQNLVGVWLSMLNDNAFDRTSVAFKNNNIIFHDYESFKYALSKLPSSDYLKVDGLVLNDLIKIHMPENAEAVNVIASGHKYISATNKNRYVVRLKHDISSRYNVDGETVDQMKSLYIYLRDELLPEKRTRADTVTRLKHLVNTDNWYWFQNVNIYLTNEMDVMMLKLMFPDIIEQHDHRASSLEEIKG